jgi:hypothetical protein
MKMVSDFLAARVSKPLIRRGVDLVLWVGLFIVLEVNTPTMSRPYPSGDSAYFAEMTQVFYLGTHPKMEYPAMHSKRLLGPWLAARVLAGIDLVAGRERAKPAEYSYLGEYSENWPAECSAGYERLLTAWGVLEFAALVAVFLALLGILERTTRYPGGTGWQPFWLALLLCCSPTLGRLYIAWPIMNDLIGIALGLASLYFLLRGKPTLSGVLFGLGMLARENLALVYPCFLWAGLSADPVQANSKLKARAALAHLALSFAPYALLSLFPVFNNLRPFYDNASGVHGAASGAWYDYVALVLYHVRRPWVADEAMTRQLVVYWQVCGPLLLLVLRAYPWTRKTFKEDWLLWTSLALCAGTSFYVDRYVVYAVFPLLLLVRRGLGAQLSGWLALALMVCYLASVRLFATVTTSNSLQVEFIDRFALDTITKWEAGAVLLVFLERPAHWLVPRVRQLVLKAGGRSQTPT